ncbi:hypothetical protein [Pseudomonas sp. LFM046]|uniref:hypothetical protein n=1 Tax=Pseudomonas sp. LFM046 TaxID=1608357 RepID=UPI0005CFB732|nr:hypothetical protein [Pseudomonas sp. LFM046]
MSSRISLPFIAAIFAAGAISTSHADESAIAAHCQSKWSGDAMRSLCMEEQRQAAQTLARYSGPVREQCERDWGSDFKMILFCIKQQPLSSSGETSTE